MHIPSIMDYKKKNILYYANYNHFIRTNVPKLQTEFLLPRQNSNISIKSPVGNYKYYTPICKIMKWTIVLKK